MGEGVSQQASFPNTVALNAKDTLYLAICHIPVRYGWASLASQLVSLAV